jgi:hypothetical protein
MTALPDTIPQKPEDLPNWQRLFATPEQAIAELRTVFADGASGELHVMAKRTRMSWEQSAEYLRNFAKKVIPASEGFVARRPRRSAVGPRGQDRVAASGAAVVLGLGSCCAVTHVSANTYG